MSAARYAAEVLSLGHRSTVPYASFTLGQIDLAHGDTAGLLAQIRLSQAPDTLSQIGRGSRRSNGSEGA
ncbi:MAG TPA: hypothetical protein VFU22_22085 [Roseiflexaceae bacterium]|nr:hypothetical protein [Roseiflexaceae bacterium]